MKASKAPRTSRSTKKQPEVSVSHDLKTVTFRLAEEHRTALQSYAYDLAGQQDPKQQVSNNQAIQHMILHATVKNGEKLRTRESQSATGS